MENATSALNTSDHNSWGSLHLVGHSLGAHICGFAAKELRRRQSKWRIERITGLDPAQPCFKNADSTMKLHKTDALFVDIIHTNGRLLSEIGLGLPEPIGELRFICGSCFFYVTLEFRVSLLPGHVDFYPNGGRIQPGCIRIDSSYFEYLPIPLRGWYVPSVSRKFIIIISCFDDRTIRFQQLISLYAVTDVRIFI